LQHAPDLVVAAYHRVEFALAGIVYQVFGIFGQRLVVLVAALAAHLLSLTQFGDGLTYVFLVTAGILEDARGGGTHLQQGYQHRLDRHKLVAHLL